MHLGRAPPWYLETVLFIERSMMQCSSRHGESQCSIRTSGSAGGEDGPRNGLSLGWTAVVAGVFEPGLLFNKAEGSGPLPLVEQTCISSISQRHPTACFVCLDVCITQNPASDNGIGSMVSPAANAGNCFPLYGVVYMHSLHLHVYVC